VSLSFFKQFVKNLYLEYKPLYGIIISTDLQNTILLVDKSKSIRDK